MTGPVPGLGGRLRQYRKQRGWNQHAMAAVLGISQSNMSRLEADKQDLSASLMRKIVEMDEEWFGDLAGASPKLPFGTQMVPVVGSVAAGIWQKVDMDPRHHEEIPVFGLQGRFPRAQALVVDGQSMDKVFRPGTKLICVTAQDYLAAGYRIVSDLYVIARRIHADGDYELTVKQLEILKDGAHWLWPRSTQPDFQQPIKIPPASEWGASTEEADQIQAGEVVVQAIVVMEQQLVVPDSAG